MRREDIWAFLKNNSKELLEIGVNLNFEEIQFGDRYYNESGEECRFNIFGDEYSVGYTYITEDADDWGQAECHHVDWCRKNGEHSEPIELHNRLINYKSDIRDYKLNELLNK